MNKRRYIIGLSVVLLTGVVYFAASRMINIAKYSEKVSGGPDQAKISYWTCSMHRQVHQDGPGECPICHMALVPVYHNHGKETLEQASTGVESQNEAIKGTETGATNRAALSQSVHIDGERQRQAGVRMVKVVRVPFEISLNTAGRVALDVELITAVREFVQLGQRDPVIRQASRTRLRLLGMGDEEIRAIELNPGTADALYRTTSGMIWVYATLYENEVRLVRAGQNVTVVPSYDSKQRLRGTVRSISPIVDSASRSIRARILVNDPGGILKPDGFVRVTIAVNLGPQLLIPKSALIDTGERQMVFVQSGENQFDSRPVEIGDESKEFVSIRSGLKEGESVVSSGAFLIESEGKLSQSSGGDR